MVETPKTHTEEVQETDANHLEVRKLTKELYLDYKSKTAQIVGMSRLGKAPTVFYKELASGINKNVAFMFHSIKLSHSHQIESMFLIFFRLNLKLFTKYEAVKGFP